MFVVFSLHRESPDLDPVRRTPHFWGGSVTRKKTKVTVTSDRPIWGIHAYVLHILAQLDFWSECFKHSLPGFACTTNKKLYDQEGVDVSANPGFPTTIADWN
jgi:hypothetical protein